MPAIAFFPWLNLQGSYKIGKYYLLKRTSNLMPFGKGSEYQSIIDSIFNPYFGYNGPVNDGAIVCIENDVFFDDVSEDLQKALFLFAEAVRFSGLSERRLFNHVNYYNADNFKFVVQNFIPNQGGASFILRRRDGTTMSMISESVFHEDKPWHVNPTSECVFNPYLCDSLIQALEKEDDSTELSDAIFYYNLANTDRQEIPIGQEVVMLVGSLQRILGYSGHKIHELTNIFESVIIPAEPLELQKSERLNGSRHIGQVESVRGAWIRDFYLLRGDLAHGKKETKKPLVWSMYEHLLYASYVFPLLLKIRLQKMGFYRLSQWDVEQINKFEQLLCIRPLDITDDSIEAVPPWYTVLEDPLYFGQKRMIMDVLKQIYKQDDYQDIISSTNKEE